MSKKKDRKPSKDGNSYNLIVSSVLVVICAVCAVKYYQSGATNEESAGTKWSLDIPFRQSSGSPQCDFTVVDSIYAINNVEFSDTGVPTVIRGLASQWNATSKWQKQSLLHLYGNRSVQMGSESSIVYSGGTAGTPVLLKDIIQAMQCSGDNACDRNNNSSGTDDFVFDASIIRSIPELLRDIQVPSVFKGWDTPASEKSGQMWHMLSLGPSQSGIIYLTAVTGKYI